MSAGEKVDTSTMFCEVFTGLGDKLLQFFNQQRNNISLCDSVLCVDGVDFPAHACVLGAYSDSLLQSLLDVRKDNFSRLSVTSVTYDGFYPIFEYMYSGVLKFEISHLKDVQACALELGIKDLDMFFNQFVDSQSKQGILEESHVGKCSDQEDIKSIAEGSSTVWKSADICEMSKKVAEEKHIGCAKERSIVPDYQRTSGSTESENIGDVDTSGLDDYLRIFANLSTVVKPINIQSTSTTTNEFEKSPGDLLTSSHHSDRSDENKTRNKSDGNSNQPELMPSFQDSEQLERNFNEPLCDSKSSSNPQTDGSNVDTEPMLAVPAKPFNHVSREESRHMEHNQTCAPADNESQIDAAVSESVPVFISQNGDKKSEGEISMDKTSLTAVVEREIIPPNSPESADGNSETNEPQNEAYNNISIEKFEPGSAEKLVSDQDPSPSPNDVTPDKPSGGMRLRKRPLTKLNKKTHSPEHSGTKDNGRCAKPRVYVRTQVPFLGDSSESAIQLGANLKQLLQKHGVSLPTVSRRYTTLKAVHKRKRTFPRKIKQASAGVEKPCKNESSTEPVDKKKKTEEDKGIKTQETRVKAFKCPLCPRGFFREPSLKKHCEGHAYGGIHKCHVCSRSYVRLCDFTRHVRSHGTLRCEYCEFHTKSQKHYVDHNQLMHSIPKPFRCHFAECSFASSKLHDLDEHRLIHSEVKCFSCDLCGKTFSQKGGLYSHMKSCMEKRGFLCDICGRAFNHLGSMKSHRRIHVGEKPFTCSECNACFSDHRNLKRHQRIHENAFPYACDFCDKRFRHSNSRKSHMTKQHFQAGAALNPAEKMAEFSAGINPYLLSIQQTPVHQIPHPAVFMPRSRPPVFDSQRMAQQPISGQPKPDALFLNHMAQQDP